MTDLAGGVTYFWQVIAKDSHGLQTHGPVWRFTSAGDLPDLIVTQLSTSPGGHLQSGQSVILTADVRNVGSGPVVDGFAVSFKAMGQSIGAPVVGSIIPAGGTARASQAWTCISGEPGMEVTADAQRQVSETDEQNNLFIGLLSEVADNTPPALVATTPQDTSYLRSLQQASVTLADSQSAVDDAAVLASFVVSNSQNEPVAGSKSQAGDTFTFVAATILPDGEYHAALIASDTFGNDRVYGFGFSVDSQPPAKPVITGAATASGAIAPRPAHNSADQFVIELTGTREAGTSVWINGDLQSNAADEPWSVPVTLTLGANSLEVWLKDRAGNQGPSEWVDITVSTVRQIHFDYNAAGRVKRIFP